MSFVVPNRPAAGSGTPESLFRDLSRGAGGPQHLWAHQADLLRAYESHAAAPDLAVELPTGAGKTLVGMLVAEWRRRRGERVLYLCPTKQLAKQAAADAARAGIQTVDLTGTHTAWNHADEMSYRRGDAIAVAAYQAVFNSSPRLDDAQLLVLDDAHAAAGPVLDNWTVVLDRSSPGYAAVLEAVAEGLDSAIAERLLQGSDDPRDSRAGHLVDPRTVSASADVLRTGIGAAVAGTDARHAWSLIRDSLQACCVFATADQVQIRPVLPPTGGHAAYADPRQRLYLSATLGSGGELERAFGRPGIARLPVPQGWDERGTGRRFFVFPELSADFADADEEGAESATDAFIRGLVADRGRALLLAPSNRALEATADRYVPAGTAVVRAPQIANDLSAFTGSDKAVLALANRYDGIDLPDGTCRLIILAGLPVGADPHERFLAFTLGAKRVLQERMRTRLIQGAGRATRNANDWAAVIVLGRDLVAFSGMRDAQAATHPEVRAELEFGIANSQGRTAADLRDALTHFHDQDAVWRDQAEPAIAALRDRAVDHGQADSNALAASARHEIRAIQSAWRGDWPGAVAAAERAIDALAGGAELRPYQALWNYLAGQWSLEASFQDDSYGALAERLTAAAHGAAARTTWMPRRTTLRTAQPAATPAPADDLAARRVIAYARQLGGNKGVDAALVSVAAGAASTAPTTYEHALTLLGRLLGATSEKPGGQARADALWRWGEHLWIAWEAKSAQDPAHPVDAHAVRQANTHLRAAAADLDAAVPPGSVTVLATPRTGVNRSVLPLAEEHLIVATLEIVRELADDTVEAWQVLRGRLAAADRDDDAVHAAVLSSFTARGVLPSGLPGRLSGRLL